MPVANGFLTQEEFATEYFFDLAAAFCERCALPQLVDAVDPRKMFHAAYPFFTSSSRGMAAHFESFAADVRARWIRAADALVVEIGSNDGTLLDHFNARGIASVGIEPSANVAAAGAAKGIRTVVRFFDDGAVDEVLRDAGKADVILAANCFCHMHDLDALARGIERLLKRRGVLVFEDPYVGDILDANAYDQIYDEHMYYFSIEAVARWLGRYGFELVDVEAQSTHGGSMRYTLARTGDHPASARVATMRGHEARRGLERIDPYLRLATGAERSREALVALLRDEKRAGRRVVGYAATSKSTTALNYCGITAEWVEFISDTTPLKQGKFSPGMHIPVKAHREFAASRPHRALLFAWNHAVEVLAKERDFTAHGGRWIVYVPEVGFLE